MKRTRKFGKLKYTYDLFGVYPTKSKADATAKNLRKKWYVRVTKEATNYAVWIMP